MWQLLSLLVGALAAVGLLLAGGRAIEPLGLWAFVRGLLGVVIITGVPAFRPWLVGRLHPRLSRAHLLAYFATLLSLFVLIALLNLQVELGIANTIEDLARNDDGRETPDGHRDGVLTVQHRDLNDQRHLLQNSFGGAVQRRRRPNGVGGLWDDQRCVDIREREH